MKRVYVTTIIFIVSLVGVVLNTVHTYLLVTSDWSLNRLIVDWVFFLGAFLALWFFARTRSIELLTFFIALIFRSCGGLMFAPSSSMFLGISIDVFVRFGLFFILSGVGLFSILALFFEDSLPFRREFFLVAIPLFALMVSLLEPINHFRPPMGIFPIYMHNGIELSICIFFALGVGVLSVVKMMFTQSSMRYHILVPAYIVQSILWAVYLLPLALWLVITLIPLFFLSIFLYCREIEEFYQP